MRHSINRPEGAQIELGSAKADALTALCHIIERTLPGTFASIYQLTPQQRLVYCAGPNIPDNMRPVFADIPIGADVGSCGTAAWSGERVMVNNIAGDQRWRDYRSLPLQNGFTACWSEPIRSEVDEVIGTIGVYFPQQPSSRALTTEVTDSASRIASSIFARSSPMDTASFAATMEGTGTALRGLSHTLAGVLGAVGVNLSTIEEEVGSDPIVETALAYSRRAISGGLTACRALEDLACFEHAKPVSVDIGELICEFSDTLACCLADDTHLVVDLPNEDVTAFVDPVLLKRALLMLFVRTGEFTRRGAAGVAGAGVTIPSLVRLSLAYASASEVIVTIEDGGSAVEPMVEGFPAGSSNTDAVDPVLWMVNRFVEQCCGNLNIDRSPSGGARIQLRLPSIH